MLRPNQVDDRTSQIRAHAAKLHAAALHHHAEQLRKHLMQELRAWNEELQMHQSQQDQKRAELIAAKFDALGLRRNFEVSAWKRE